MKKQERVKSYDLSKRLVEIGIERKKDFYNSRWAKSVIEDWKVYASTKSRGFDGEKLICEYFEFLGFDCIKCNNKEGCDIIVAGYGITKRIEIKTSTISENGNYKINQLRDQKYDLLLCYNIDEKNNHSIYIVPKPVIVNLIKKGIIKGQHSGKTAKETKSTTLDIIIKAIGDSYLVNSEDIKKATKSNNAHYKKVLAKIKTLLGIKKAK